MTNLLIRWFRDDSGQDMIEYALLSGLIATVGALAWQNIGTTLGGKYIGWDTGTQNLWEPNAPISGGS